jgi:hypothetical protein
MPHRDNVAESMHVKFEVLHHVHSMGRRALLSVVELYGMHPPASLYVSTFSATLYCLLHESIQAQQNHPPTLLQL